MITYAEPECDNVLQPEPQSCEGCNTLSHSGVANVIIIPHMNFPKRIRNRMLYHHCYIPSFQAQAVPNNFIQLYAEMSTLTTKPHRIGGNRKS